MKDYIKSEIKHIPFVLILFILFYGIVTFATTTLFNSSEVYYNNTTSGIQADKVQGAIDELYACASNYAAYNQRLTNAENTIGSGSLTTTSQNLIGGINEINDNIIPQVVGTKFEGYFGAVASAQTSSYMIFCIYLPFYAKNTNYTFTIKTGEITNVGTPTGYTIYNKYKGYVYVRADISGLTTGRSYLIRGSYEVTFA